MTDAEKHTVLLDALEGAGFPRSALVGAGNAISWDDGAVRVEARKDGLMYITLTHSGGQSMAMNMGKAPAARLGAFLLAWGYSP